MFSTTDSSPSVYCFEISAAWYVAGMIEALHEILDARPA